MSQTTNKKKKEARLFSDKKEYFFVNFINTPVYINYWPQCQSHY